MRAFHHKSRHGCLTCKRRRKRCDLQNPICGPCQKLRLYCSYPDALWPSLPTKIGTNQSLPNLVCYAHPLYEAIVRRPGFVENGDLELASHFLRADPAKLTTIPGLHAIRQLDFATKVPGHPYLLHGVLAASALHLALTETVLTEESTAHWMTKARFHQHLALSSYIASLNTLDSQSCHFIFGFSLVLAGLQLAFCCPLNPSEAQNVQPNVFISTFAKMFDLMQGAVTVADAASKWIPQSRTGTSMIPIRAMMHTEPIAIEPEADAALQDLIAGIHRLQDTAIFSGSDTSRHDDTAATCIAATLALRNVFGCLSRKEPQNSKAALGWFAFVSPSYSTLVKARRPAALVVLAFFGVALHILDHAWWLQGIGSKLVVSVDHVVRAQGAEKWYDLLRWPLSRVSRAQLCANSTYTATATLSEAVDAPRRTHSPFERAFEYTCSVGFSDE